MKKKSPAPMISVGGKEAQNWMLSLELIEKTAASQLFMPYIKGGAVFVATTKEYQLGDSVYIILTVGEKKAKFAINGKVVWINGLENRGDRPAGIGVQFPRDENGEAAKLAIENFIGQTQASAKRLPAL